jgi:hypothetical protein
MAAAIIANRKLPDKLTPIIKPLMSSIQTEDKMMLQELSGEALAELIVLCVDREPCPNERIVNNLCIIVTTPLTSQDAQQMHQIRTRGASSTLQTICRTLEGNSMHF